MSGVTQAGLHSRQYPHMVLCRSFVWWLETICSVELSPRSVGGCGWVVGAEQSYLFVQRLSLGETPGSLLGVALLFIKTALSF